MDDNPWLARRVIAYAHQGGAKEAPSSTLYAIERAVSLGVPAIELDVHATADGEIVVCHDPTVDRTTNGSGEIRQFTRSELERFDNAYFFVDGEDAQRGRDEASYVLRGRAPSDPAFRIAALDEILERFPGVVLNLDIKRSAPDVEPYEQALAELLRRYERRDDVIVASFNDVATDSFSLYAPEIATSAGTQATAEMFRAVHAGEPVPDSARLHAALQVPATFGEIVVIDELFVTAAHEAGLAVHVWTVDDKAEMERLLDLGVDGIISDVPSVLMTLLDERGAAWRP